MFDYIQVKKFELIMNNMSCDNNKMGSSYSMCMQKFDVENPRPRSPFPEVPSPAHTQDPQECVIHECSGGNAQTPFMTNVIAFSKQFDDPNSFVGSIQRVFPAAAPQLNAQMKTFVGDMMKFEQGQMSYAEMRSLYG